MGGCTSSTSLPSAPLPVAANDKKDKKEKYKDDRKVSPPSPIKTPGIGLDGGKKEKKDKKDKDKEKKKDKKKEKKDKAKDIGGDTDLRRSPIEVTTPVLPFIDESRPTVAIEKKEKVSKKEKKKRKRISRITTTKTKTMTSRKRKKTR